MTEGTGPRPGATVRQRTAFGSLSATAVSPAPSVSATFPRGLKSLARSLGHLIYWVGKKKGCTYELTRGTQGDVTIRYLPPRTNVGTTGAHVTVATYPFHGAFAAIQAVAKHHNAETFDPSPAQARTIASSGKVTVVE